MPYSRASATRQTRLTNIERKLVVAESRKVLFFFDKKTWTRTPAGEMERQRILDLVDRIHEAARTAERLFLRYRATAEGGRHASRDLVSRFASQLYNLRNGRIKLVDDWRGVGVNPLPPQYCYLKPHYLDVHTSYFDHLESGAL